MGWRGLVAAAGVVAMLAVVGCRRGGAACPCEEAAAPSQPGRAMASGESERAVAIDDDPWAWAGPYCLAYSPRLAAYACVSLEATPTEASGEDLSSPSMLDTAALVRRRGADVEIGIELVSAHGAQAHVVLDTVPNPTTRVESLEVVREELSRRGYTEPIVGRAVLEPGRWVAVGRVELRYSVDLHEGDASFEYHGVVEIRCTPEGPAQEVEIRCTPEGPAQEVVFDADGIGGPFAVVSSAAGATVHAITVEHQDGGEGYVDVQWSSWLVDEARYCG